MSPSNLEVVFSKFQASLNTYLVNLVALDQEKAKVMFDVLDKLAQQSPMYLWSGELSQTFHQNLIDSASPFVTEELCRLVVMLKNECGRELYEEFCRHIVFSTHFSGNSGLSHVPAAWRLFCYNNEIGEAVYIRALKPKVEKQGFFWRLLGKSDNPPHTDLSQVALVYLSNNPHLVYIYLLMMKFQPSAKRAE